MQLIKITNASFYLSLVFIFFSCQQKQKTNKVDVSTEETEAPQTIIDESFKSRDFDASDYNAIINSLNGIEKFYVQDDLYRVHSLLKFKNDERYIALENDLKRKYEYPNFINITLLDGNNGYIEFYVISTECKQAMVYWNKTNGDKLIGNTLTCCTMFCEGDISFLLYSQKSQTYTPIETKEIIDEIDVIKSKRPDNYVEGDGFDYEFILPRKGKNLRYCVEQSCLDLIWQDGTFSTVD